MTASITYIGDPATGEGPTETTLWGLTLPKDVPVSTDNEKAIEMAHRNPHFLVDGETVEATPPPTKPQLRPDQVDIPDDWQDLHHFTRMKLAKQLAPDLAEAINSADEADEVIQGVLDERHLQQ